MDNAEYTSNLAALEKATDALLLQNMKAAGAFVEGVVKQKISVRNEPRRRVGGRMVGMNPSKEGEPPKVMEGVLRANVAHAVTVTSTEVSAYVGIQGGGQADKYARRLELGFHGKDSAGRNVNQGPRPYLRPSVSENPDAIMQIICTGKAPRGSQRGTKRMSDVSGVISGE